MKVSALEEYGLRCILRVAADFEDDTPLTASEVADAESISVPYAQKILRLLSRAQLVESRRGVGGGYALARHPDRISVGDVMRALDASFDTSDVCERHTGEDEVCARAGACSIQPMWSFIEEFINQTLDNLTLSTLLRGDRAVSTQLERFRVTATGELYCPVSDLTATEPT
jgi:Rrf2 family protein